MHYYKHICRESFSFALIISGIVTLGEYIFQHWGTFSWNAFFMQLTTALLMSTLFMLGMCLINRKRTLKIEGQHPEITRFLDEHLQLMGFKCEEEENDTKLYLAQRAQEFGIKGAALVQHTDAQTLVSAPKRYLRKLEKRLRYRKEPFFQVNMQYN